MIQHPLILLHEESLRITHPVFNAAPQDTRVIYVWDDAYFQRTSYSLKRLIFIYETLCGLELDILRGDVRSILQEINPSKVYIPFTNNPLLLEIIDSLSEIMSVQTIDDSAFVSIKKPIESKRFFQYWRQAEITAFLINGGVNA
jgi:hypothetical protein